MLKGLGVLVVVRVCSRGFVDFRLRGLGVLVLETGEVRFGDMGTAGREGIGSVT